VLAASGAPGDTLRGTLSLTLTQNDKGIVQGTYAISGTLMSGGASFPVSITGKVKGAVGYGSARMFTLSLSPSTAPACAADLHGVRYYDRLDINDGDILMGGSSDCTTLLREHWLSPTSLFPQ